MPCSLVVGAVIVKRQLNALLNNLPLEVILPVKGGHHDAGVDHSGTAPLQSPIAYVDCGVVANDGVVLLIAIVRSGEVHQKPDPPVDEHPAECFHGKLLKRQPRSVRVLQHWGEGRVDLHVGGLDKSQAKHGFQGASDDIRVHRPPLEAVVHCFGACSVDNFAVGFSARRSGQNRALPPVAAGVPGDEVHDKLMHIIGLNELFRANPASVVFIKLRGGDVSDRFFLGHVATS